MTVDPEQMSLAGKVAAVTGGGRGLGAATALGFAAFGADVSVCDRDEQSLDATGTAIEAAGRRSFSALLDVRDAPAMEAWLEQTHQQLGPIHVLVNNAGGTFRAPFEQIRPKGEAALVALNFTALVATIRAALPWLAEGASIINVTSIEAHRAAPGYSIYAAAKAAVENLSKSLAVELSDRRIRVNVLAPDAIPTPGDDALAAEVDSYASYKLKVPLGLGTPDDFAGAAVYLASDLSRWVTGAVIHVDGGSHACGGWRQAPDGTWGP